MAEPESAGGSGSAAQPASRPTIVPGVVVAVVLVVPGTLAWARTPMDSLLAGATGLLGAAAFLSCAHPATARTLADAWTAALLLAVPLLGTTT